MLVFNGFALSVIIQPRARRRFKPRQVTYKSPPMFTGTKAPIWLKDTLIAGAKELQELHKNPKIAFASGRLSFFGLLTAGNRTLSARGVSFEPQVEGDLGNSFKFIEGRGFTKDELFHVALG
jgi:hypothetical protein